MSRLTRFTVSVAALTLIGANECEACIGSSYAPREYYMFRVYDKTDKSELQASNLELWQKMTSSGIPLEDIEEAVYKYTLTQTISAFYGNEQKNQFILWVNKKYDQEIKDFLILAKKNEELRLRRNSKWYYPRKNDPLDLDLAKVAAVAMEYNGKRLGDRYALQAVRALYTLGKMEQMIEYWNKNESRFPEGTIKNMARDYVAGACVKTGNLAQAKTLYFKSGNYGSMYEHCRPGGDNLLECLAMFCPDKQSTFSLIQDNVHNHESGDFSSYSIDELIKVCNIAQANPICKKKAQWYYTEAFLHDLLGDSFKASSVLRYAEAAGGDPFIKGSVKILRMYLDAKNLPFDASYKAKLTRDLRWLCSMIENNIDNPDANTDEAVYRMHANISHYYWNDMLRKIALGYICPKLLEQGDNVLALHLSNVADNFFISFNDSIKEERYPQAYSYWGNYHDFSDNFFRLMDSLDIKDLRAYVASLESPRTPLERLLGERSYKDMDYLNDIVGTRYLREFNYPEAVSWLSKVSASYQERLNVRKYMRRLPFEYEMTKSATEIPNYKLSFAKEMVRLENIVYSYEHSMGATADEAGAAMVRMSIGMNSSYNYCWALTHYGKEYDDWHDDEEVMNLAKANASFMRWKGFATIKSPEAKSKAYMSICRCDRARDYVRN